MSTGRTSPIAASSALTGGVAVEGAALLSPAARLASDGGPAAAAVSTASAAGRGCVAPSDATAALFRGLAAARSSSQTCALCSPTRCSVENRSQTNLISSESSRMPCASRIQRHTSVEVRAISRSSHSATRGASSDDMGARERRPRDAEPGRPPPAPGCDRLLPPAKCETSDDVPPTRPCEACVTRYFWRFAPMRHRQRAARDCEPLSGVALRTDCVDGAGRVHVRGSSSASKSLTSRIARRCDERSFPAARM